MTKIHIVRHGETDWNLERRIQGQQESHLTEQGKAQAQALAEKLKHIPFHAVYASSSLRARTTAEIIMHGRGIEIDTHDSLREICLGPWEGRLYQDIEKEHPQDYLHFRHAPSNFNVPGAENFQQLQERALSVFVSIVKINRGKEILIVSHGALIKTLLAHFEGRHLKNLWAPPAMHNCAHSIVEEITPGQYAIRQYADMTAWSVPGAPSQGDQAIA